jgi:carbamoyl-phosphate synthase large subunit
MLYDEYQIRRKAVEMGIPVLTTIEAATSFVESLNWRTKNQPTIGSLHPYIEK